MSQQLVTVEQAAQELSLHPKTVLRYIRDNRLPEIENVTAEAAERMATFLQSAALTGDADTPPLRVQTAFDTAAHTLKIVMIGVPSDVARLLEMLHLRLSARA